MNGLAGAPPAASGIAELTQRMHRLEAQMAALTGAVEELAPGDGCTST